MHRIGEQSIGWAAALLLGTAGSPAIGQTLQAVYSGNTLLGHDIANSRECGFVATGNAQPPFAQNFHAYVMRLTPEGKVAWSNLYFNDDALTSSGYSVVESADTNDLIVGGYAGIAALGRSVRFVLRTDSAGTPVWAVGLEGTESLSGLGKTFVFGFEPVGVTEMHKGQIASISRKTNSNGVARLGLLALVDANGSAIFSNRYIPAGGATAALDFIQVRETRDPDPSNELLVVGSTVIATNRIGLFAMRTDINGNVIWAKNYRTGDGVTSMLGGGFDLAANGDILFSASREVLPIAGAAPPNSIMGRIDALTGEPVWATSVDGFVNGYEAVVATPGDGMIVTGLVGTPPGNTLAAAIRLDGAGHNVQMWSYGDGLPNARAAGDSITSIRPGGGYAIFGRSQEIAADSWAYLVRTNNDMLSGCSEAELHVAAESIEIRANDAALSVVADPLFELFHMLAVDLGSKQEARCLFSRCVGDLNGDGLVDDTDFVLFANAYDVLVCPTDPSTSCCLADLNSDGLVDDSDFVLFANAYDQLICA